MTVYGALGGAGAASRDIQASEKEALKIIAECRAKKGTAMIRVNLGEISLLLHSGKAVVPIVAKELADAILDRHQGAIKVEHHLESGNVVLTIILRLGAIESLGTLEPDHVL